MENFKEEFECTCGRVHKVPHIDIVLEEDSFKHLDQFFDDATYLVDENTSKLIDTAFLKTIELEGRPRVLATMENIKTVASQLETSTIVSIGSGSLTDIAKYAARLTGKNFSCCPTAPSVDGYTSSVAAILIDGEKTTVQGVVPKRIVIDPNVLIRAPHDLLRAGIGDIAAKVTARLDWMLSNILIGEPVCEFTWEHLEEPLEVVLNESEKILSRDKNSVLELMKILLISGLNITVVGNSRPASGAEHLISHTLEMFHENRNEVPMFHGLSVAMGTYIVLKAYEVLFKDLRLKNACVTNEERFGILSEFFGETKAERFMRVYEKKNMAKELNVSFIKSLKPVYERFHEKVQHALRVIRVEDLFADYDTEFIVKLILISNTIRERYTVLDLLDQMCLLKDFAKKVFEI